MPAWTTIYVVAFWPLLALVSVLCFWLGDRPTRLAALAFLLAMIAGQLTLSRPMFSSLEVIPAAIDMMLVLALAVLSIKFPRWWLMMMTAVLCATWLGHLAQAIGMIHSRLTYAILTGSGGYPTIILLSAGLIDSIRNRNTPTSRRA